MSMAQQSNGRIDYPNNAEERHNLDLLVDKGYVAYVSRDILRYGLSDRLIDKDITHVRLTYQGYEYLDGLDAF